MLRFFLLITFSGKIGQKFAREAKLASTIRLAMVPRNSQQLSEQLTSSSEEQLLNKWQKTYFGANMTIF